MARREELWTVEVGRRIAKLKRTREQTAEKLIGRILFLEGIPIVSKYNEIHIGADVSEMYKNDHLAEADAIRNYNSAIALCGEARDYATRDILEAILKDEDAHIDNIEAIQDEIKQMGIQVFLSMQLG